jgi:hypothetical protein
VLGYAPVAALPVAALDFAAATVLPATGPLRFRRATVIGLRLGRSRVVASRVKRSAVVPGVRVTDSHVVPGGD